jgi:hypothetical protein
VSKEKIKRVEYRLAKEKSWKAWIEKSVKEHNEKNRVKPITDTVNITQPYGSFFITGFPMEQCIKV